MTEKLFAFVLMPFNKEFDDIYKLGIKSAVESLGMIVNRVDEQVFHREGILERIYNQIDVADFIIADMTDRNPNVFYEVGYAHAKKKVCILLTSRADDIPFDLKHHRHIVYNNSISLLKNALIEDIKVIEAEIASMGSPVAISLAKSYGVLSKTKYSAEAEVELFFDFNNNSSDASPKIEAVYFYTGDKWLFKQDGQDCSKTKSDIDLYSLRHLVRSPVPRLPRGGWAQIKIKGNKTLAYSFNGEELRDSYKLNGEVLFRVMTSRGDYRYPININMNIDEIPF